METTEITNDEQGMMVVFFFLRELSTERHEVSRTAHPSTLASSANGCMRITGNRLALLVLGGCTP